jgi:triacylglycerol lipase
MSASSSVSTTRNLVDPELLPLLDLRPEFELTLETLPFVRSAFTLPAREQSADATAVEMTVRVVPGPPGAPEVRLITYRPPKIASPVGAILHLHGGGYVVGTPEALEAAHRGLSAELNCVIASVDYRLAPETVAPGAVEDGYAALSWLVRDADALGVDAARIGVMGESAGGGLAAALALLVRDRGEHRLAFQHLIYPMLDDRTCVAEAPHPYAGEFIWNAEKNRFGWRCLLGMEPGGTDISPYAAPARATELAGLPPTYIVVGALDLFIDEDIEYARRLVRAGVPVELHVYPGAYHGFHFEPKAQVTKTAAQDSMSALERALRAQA